MQIGCRSKIFPRLLAIDEKEKQSKFCFPLCLDRLMNICRCVDGTSVALSFGAVVRD